MNSADTKNGNELNNEENNAVSRSPIFVAASVISPVIIYHYVNVIVLVIFAMAVSGSSQLNEGVNATIMHNNSLELAMVIKIAALILAIAPLVPGFLREGPVYGMTSRLGMVYNVLLGIILPIFINVVFFVLGITGADSQYTQVQANQFSLPVWGGVLLYGLVTPVCEEIVNRGLVYNRVKHYAGVPAAVIVSALIFGISHGNVAQFLYAFVLGCVIALIYEKYDSFLYPVVFHAVANSVIYIAMSNDQIKGVIVAGPFWILCGVMSLVTMVLMQRQKV